MKQMVGNVETHTWWKSREKVSVDFSITNGTSKIYPSKDEGPLRRRGQKRWQAPDNAKNQSKQCLLNREKLWHVGIHEQDQVSPHYGIEGEDAPEPPLLTKEL